MRDQMLGGGVQTASSYGSRAGDIYPDNAKITERGSVDREVGKLEEAVAALEHTVQKHAARIRSIVLDVPEAANDGGPCAPDVAVCDVASTVRELRRRMEAITGVLARITSRVDL